MFSEEGKEEILNPKGKVLNLKGSWEPTNFKEQVVYKMYKNIGDFLRSKDISDRFLNLKKELDTFVKEVLASVSRMESDWLIRKDEELKKFFEDDDFSPTLQVLKFIQDWESYSCLAFMNFLYLPITHPVMLFLYPDARKKKITDREFEKCRELISERLNHTCGFHLRRMSKMVAVDILPRRIAHLQEMEKQLLELREEILKNRNIFLGLEKDIVSMEKCAETLQTFLERRT